MAKMTIKANRDYITIILDKVINGEYAIPEFQRDFVWSNRAVVELFDSIIKGYPIGSLILWQPEEERFRTLDDLEGIGIAKHNNVNDRMYVLDGRQRLTALASVLYPNGTFYNNVYINLDDMQILFVNSKRNQNGYRLLKLGVAFDTYELVGFLEKVKSSGLTDVKKREYAEKAKMVNKILLSYELGYIAVYGGYIDDAEEIFSRLNSKSIPISKDYMLQALTYNPKSDFLFAKEISVIQQKLQSYNFQNTKRDILLKCAYTYADVPFIDGKVESLLKMKDKLQDIMSNVAEDIMLTADFLYWQCGVIDYRLLPYNYQFIMLASFFRWNKRPSITQIKELKKWFFYTTYSAYFTNTSLSVIREDIQRFSNYSKGEGSTPIAYQKTIELTVPKKLVLNNVRACAFVITTILKNNLLTNNAQLEIVTIPHAKSKNIGSSFICTDKKDVETITSWLQEKKWTEELNRFGVNKDLARVYSEENEETFVLARSHKLINDEMAFVRELIPDCKLSHLVTVGL